MFRWTALCLVLCAGAFALVAMATGAFNPSPPRTGETPVAAGPIATDNNDAVHPPSASGLGRGGALIIHDARLTAYEREEVPSQRDGTMSVVGTDDPEATGEALKAIRVPFLARLIDPNDRKAPPEDEWYVLNKDKTEEFRFPEALNQARVKADWARWKAVPTQKFYVRWKEGDPLLPKKVVVAFERKIFHKLNEGDWVKKDQLVALVDPTVQVNDVSSKVAKMETAESEWQAAIKTRDEAIRRAASSTLLHQKGAGFISEDTYQADLLNRDRYIEEEKGKDAARDVANEDLAASLTILKQHHIRASISGVIKVIYKHTGESVKNLDPILQIQDPEKLRVEGLADWQDAQILAKGMEVVIEPTRPMGPIAILSGHQQEVHSVAVSRAGKNGKKLILSASEDGDVRFWDLTARGEPLVAHLNHGTGVLAVACTGPKATRNLALTGDRNGVGRLIDLDRLLPAPAAAIGAGAKQVQAMPLKLSAGHQGPITCVAFSPDGALCATGGEDRAIRLWNTDDGKLVHTLFAAHKAAVTSVQFAQEKGKVLQLVSAGGDNTLHVWNLEKADAPTPTPVLPRRGGDVAQLGVSTDGKYVLFDHGSEIRVLSLADRQIEGVIQSSSAATNFTTMALFAPDGNTVLTNSASDGRLQLWRTPGQLAIDGQGRAAELRQFARAEGGTATCAAFDPDEKQPAFVVTGSRDNSVIVWPMPKTEEILAKPRETKLTMVGHSLDNGSRQVAVWAEVENPDWNKQTGLKPGGSATMVVPPMAPVVEAK
jgi:WD40 repeat protein